VTTTINDQPDTSPRTAARVAGIGYVALFVLAIFANFVVRERLVDGDDKSATVQNLVADDELFRAGVAAFVVVFLIDIAVSWALYVLLRSGGSARSLAAAWFRLVHAVLLAVAATFMFLALELAGGSIAAGLDGTERESWTMLAIEAFDFTWLVGLAAFGVHLLLTGRLLAAAAGARVLGGLLTVAGAAYLFDTAAYTLFADYADHEDTFLAVVAVPSVVAELAFTIWLLRFGWRRGDDQDIADTDVQNRMARRMAVGSPL
jgi:hypothetical protein